MIIKPVVFTVPIAKVLCIVAAAGAPLAEPREVARNFRARQQAIVTMGPEREASDPHALDEVLLGYFGPSVEEDSASGNLWGAARMAIDRANAEGGYRGIPFRLAPAWSESPWQAGVQKLASLVYKDRIWAIVGGIDGPSTHLAEQIAAKARLAVISPVTTDKSANLAGVPWIFSCSAGDHLAAPRLCAAIVGRSDQRPLVMVESDRHDPHQFAVELRKCLSLRRVAPEHHLQFHAGDQPPDGAQLGRLVAWIMRTGPGAVVIVAGPSVSGSLVRQLVATGYTGPIFGGPAMARRMFLRAAGRAADGAVFPLVSTVGTDDVPTAWHPFASRFQKRYGRAADGAAGKMFDAVSLLIEAIRAAGLNRAGIGDAIRNLAPWQGVAGPIAWDPVGANTEPVRLGTIKGGQLKQWAREKE
jgi:ABC-type branched-subunit amino acid transport system substrate-binding protein